MPCQGDLPFPSLTSESFTAQACGEWLMGRMLFMFVVYGIMT
jgi:hypothetical protein